MIIYFSRAALARKAKKSFIFWIMALLFGFFLVKAGLFFWSYWHHPAIPSEPVVDRPMRVEINPQIIVDSTGKQRNWLGICGITNQ